MTIKISNSRKLKMRIKHFFKHKIKCLFGNHWFVCRSDGRNDSIECYICGKVKKNN